MHFAQTDVPQCCFLKYSSVSRIHKTPVVNKFAPSSFYPSPFKFEIISGCLLFSWELLCMAWSLTSKKRYLFTPIFPYSSHNSLLWKLLFILSNDYILWIINLWKIAVSFCDKQMFQSKIFIFPDTIRAICIKVQNKYVETIIDSYWLL